MIYCALYLLLGVLVGCVYGQPASGLLVGLAYIGLTCFMGWSGRARS
ncbi:MAG TPA: hypothetical protein VN803_08465 [Gemmatimonadales bacterium]|nr:hypothetical protein [Gemmatimonadales bacterium]